ncbi:MAG: antibiotic biosynthesis monooxygenase [Burkholderiaceae bacterium]|nr:antibiotic biosynthesis monooxygenase [Burkholderiaceae bacterium]
MLIERFRIQCRPEKADQALAALVEVARASRGIDGVIHFDIGRDILDPNTFIATEVFVDRAALDRQESIPEVHKIMGLFPDLLAGDPEATIFHVSSHGPAA